MLPCGLPSSYSTIATDRIYWTGYRLPLPIVGLKGHLETGNGQRGTVKRAQAELH
jgi:hypothetical protein